MSKKAWDGVIAMPRPGRSEKPRTTGWTMVIDKGLGPHDLEDLLDVAADYIDIVKLTLGTSAFYDKKLLREKNEETTDRGVHVMPAGTFLEVAVWQGRINDFFRRAAELAFNVIEVSDGTIPIEPSVRRDLIKKALDKGFKVVTATGRKDALPIALTHQLIHDDLDAGASKVIIDASQAGQMEAIVTGVSDLDALIWEAPLESQQRDFILRFGTNVSLGDVPPEEILALEALRQGLRGDTLKKAYRESLI